jgi:hypothetical protein
MLQQESICIFADNLMQPRLVDYIDAANGSSYSTVDNDVLVIIVNRPAVVS